jgi:hypothetical protein
MSAILACRRRKQEDQGPEADPRPKTEILSEKKTKAKRAEDMTQ